MMRAVILIIAIIASMAYANEAPAATDGAAVAPSTTLVCNTAELQALSAAVESLKTQNEAAAKSISDIPSSVAKLRESIESQSAKLLAAPAAAAAAPVDLAPVLAAIDGINTKVAAFATADDESDRSESAALVAVATDITSLKSSVASITSDLKDTVSKSQGVSSSRFETLEKEVASLKALVQQLVDNNAAKGKKEDHSQINQVLENQAEILKLYRQANEPFDWKATLGNATQTAAKYSRYALDFGVAKGTVAWNAFVEYVKHVQANPPDFKQWKADALKVQGDVASFLQTKGVPKDKTTLVANILLGVGAVIAVLIVLSITIKFIRCICCCGRKSKKATIPAAPSMEEEGKLKEEADVPAPSSSGASKRKGKKSSE